MLWELGDLFVDRFIGLHADGEEKQKPHGQIHGGSGQRSPHSMPAEVVAGASTRQRGDRFRSGEVFDHKR